METISRRDVLRSSGILLTSPLAVSTGMKAYAQSPAATTFPPMQYSKDLHCYVTEGLSQMIHKIRVGSGLTEVLYQLDC